MTRFQSNADIKTFLLAGKAILTLRSARTGTRYTFKVSKAKDRELWFVKLLTGSDNYSSYSYIGYFYKDLKFKTSAKSQFGFGALPMQAMRVLLEGLRQEEPKVHRQLEVYHEGSCGRCGRRLTVPESLMAGLGPECLKLSA